jgi:hypothetical protein
MTLAEMKFDVSPFSFSRDTKLEEENLCRIFSRIALTRLSLRLDYSRIIGGVVTKSIYELFERVLQTNKRSSLNRIARKLTRLYTLLLFAIALFDCGCV